MTMFERKVRISAAQPKGDQNGLMQPDALEAMTKGFGREAKHIAVVEFVVSDQTTSAASGTVTNVVAFNRIEVVDGMNAEQATRILRETFTARQPEALPGMDADTFGDEQPEQAPLAAVENIGGRGNE